MKPTIKILHTADLHLGAKFVKLGARGSEQRRRLCETLKDITALALREHADVVLFAGDTFDHHLPSPESTAAFENAARQLADSGIPVIMIAGTHDGLGQKGYLDQYLSTETGKPILLHAGRPFWKLEAKHLVIHGISQMTADDPKRPVAGLHASAESCWQIGLAHASLDIGQGSQPDALISRQEIAATGLHYLALGHWHRQRDCSAGDTVCWYPGAPEMIALDESGKGAVLMVELSDGKPPTVVAHPIGRRSVLKTSLAPQDLEAGIQRLRAQSDPDQILDLTLSGVVAPEQMPDLEQLRKSLEPDFFFVQVRNDLIPEIPAGELGKYSEQTVLGRFVRLLQEHQAAAPESQRAEWGEALQLGLALLSGREVPPCS